MQIPVVVFDDIDKIKIYNGSKLDTNEVSIELLEEIDKNDCIKKKIFLFGILLINDFGLNIRKTIQTRNWMN